MIVDKIKRAVDLVKRTGDKIFLFEDENSDGVVIMSLDEYEKMIDSLDSQAQNPASKDHNSQEIGNLTEDELIDRINRNIAAWQSQNQDQLDEYKIIESFLGDMEDEEEEPEEDNLYYYGEENFLTPATSETEEEEKGQEEEESEATLQEEEQPEQESRQPQEEEGEGDKRGSNWEIPVNIKRNAEEVEE